MLGALSRWDRQAQFADVRLRGTHMTDCHASAQGVPTGTWDPPYNAASDVDLRTVGGGAIFAYETSLKLLEYCRRADG